ncbi:MAG TPA: hypothetical protein V6C65_11945 [Allocoleopsis sp.]
MNWALGDNLSGIWQGEHGWLNQPESLACLLLMAARELHDGAIELPQRTCELWSSKKIF